MSNPQGQDGRMVSSSIETENASMRRRSLSARRDDSHVPNFVRSRTRSIIEYIAQADIMYGEVVEFNREKGYGFVQLLDTSSHTSSDGTATEPPQLINKQKMFFHISDIASDFIPLVGDNVSFKTVHIPPKINDPHAVEVKILNLTTKHKRWSDPKC